MGQCKNFNLSPHGQFKKMIYKKINKMKEMANTILKAACLVIALQLMTI